jgi:hypothetical protein
LFQEARDVNLFLSRFLSYLFSVQSGCFWSLQGPLYYNNNFSKENRKIKKGKKLPIDNEHGPGSTVPRRGLPVLFLPPSSAAGRHLQGPASPPASSSGPLPWKRDASKLLLRPPAPTTRLSRSGREIQSVRGSIRVLEIPSLFCRNFRGV